MAEKQYYIDKMNSVSTVALTKGEKIYIYICIILAFIFSIISYNVIMHYYGYELNTYSSDTYNRLEEIPNIVIREDTGFDLLAIPEDVYSYNISYVDDEINFEYTLKTNEDFFFAPSPKMSIVLNQDLKILAKSSSYTEELYKRSIKGFICSSSFGCGLFFFGFLMLLHIPVMYIGMLISYIHKKIELSKESKQKN